MESALKVLQIQALTNIPPATPSPLFILCIIPGLTKPTMIGAELSYEGS